MRGTLVTPCAFKEKARAARGFLISQENPNKNKWLEGEARPICIREKGAQFFNTEADKPLEQITKGGDSSAFADAFR